MNLKNLTDDALLQNTESLVKSEREILSQVLHHFREIERRRLYSALKFKSLYDYATQKLGYSEDQAYRRIQAMRLLKEIPEIEEKINSGALSLTHMGMAQSLFKNKAKSSNETYSIDQKLEILEKFEGTSKREAEKVVIELVGKSHVSYQETVKAYSTSESEIRCAVPNDTLKKIEQLKGLRAHKNPNMSLAELIDQLCDLGLEQWLQEKKGPSKKQVNSEDISAPARDALRKDMDVDSNGNALLLAAPRVGFKNERPDSQASIRRQVWREAQGRCQNCESVYALQTDHHWPKALGGSSAKENLRLLCRSCNQRAAIEAFGLAKMDRYLERRG